MQFQVRKEQYTQRCDSAHCQFLAVWYISELFCSGTLKFCASVMTFLVVMLSSSISCSVDYCPHLLHHS